MYFKKKFIVSGIIGNLLLITLVAGARTFDTMKAQVKEYTLKNGMKFIVLERHEAPIVSFHMYADVGSAQEVYGITGISHLLEHMAFKGTKTVGTKNYEEEAKLLEKIDKLYEQLVHAQSAAKPDSIKLNALQAEFDEANKAAHDLVIVNEYIDLLFKEGGVGVNAYTSNDATQYIVSLPSNRLELWMAMESDRFMNPIFRQFFEERNVVMEERRLGIETQPTGKLIEDFFAVAFKAHPYNHHVIGHMSDLKRITRNDVMNYFYKYYNPGNLTVAIVGDVNPEEVFRMAETYFSRIPSNPKPESLRTVEPEQWGERHLTIEAQAQPLIVVGYHRPAVTSNEDLSLDAMANIFGIGRSSRLYAKLVKDKKIAIQVGAFNGWPGNKYPNLFAVYAVPAKNHTSAECLEAIDNEIKILINESVTENELTKYKQYTKKWLIDRMKSNSQMAASLTFYEVIFGDWQKAFDRIYDVESLSTADIQKVAQKYLIKKHRTVGEIIPE